MTRNLLFLSALTAVVAAAGQPVRYLSAAGDDAADGLTPATAWRSLDKLARDLPAGAEARLRRGDVFFGQVRLRPGPDADHRTTVTSYGTGPDAEIHAYKIAKRDPAVWTPTGTNNLWRLDLADFSKFDGNHMTSNGNVGFLVVDGKIFGRKHFRDAARLTQQWDFIDDQRTITVWSAKNPAEMAREIKFAPQMGIIPFQDHIAIDHLVVRGTGAHGSSGTGCDVRITHCGFHEIGGSLLPGFGDGVTRYGNGVECWTGSSDILVANCTFSEIYDTAFTMQGPNPSRTWANTHVVDCIFSNCTQCTELWVTGAQPGVGYKNCSFQRNRCIDTGRGWAYEVRPDKVNATPLLMYSMETDTCDYLVKDNTFINSRGSLIFKSGGLADLPATYRILHNTIVLPANRTIEQSVNGRAASPSPPRGAKPSNTTIGYCVGKDKAAAEQARAESIRANNHFVCAGDETATHANPVIPSDFPDPTFWQGNDGWYYGTATGRKTIRRSRDLVTWEDTGTPQIDPASLAELQKFTPRNFWAPDAVKVGKDYLLYVTQFISSDTNRLVVLSSETPKGPFRYRGVVVENWKYGKRDLGIDADVVPDGDTLRLFIGSVAGGVWRTELTSDGLALKPGATFTHVAGLIPEKDDRPWIYSHRCYEGSYLYRHGDWWYLFVSCGSIHGGSYKLCAGRAKNLTDAFVDRQGTPLTEGGGEVLLATDPASDFSGAGHNGEIFADKDGRTFMLLHSQWKGTGGPNWRNGARCTSLQEVHWDKDGWPWFETGALKGRDRKPQ